MKHFIESMEQSEHEWVYGCPYQENYAKFGWKYDFTYLPCCRKIVIWVYKPLVYKFLSKYFLVHIGHYIYWQDCTKSVHEVTENKDLFAKTNGFGIHCLLKDMCT